MSAYFDNMRARISALKPEDAWDRAADLERGLVRDVTICVMLPGFPAQWKRRVHEAVLKYGVCTLPSNAPPRDFETFDEHRQLLHGLCQDLHTVFHGVAQEDAPGFNDNPRQALDFIYYDAGDQERAAIVALGEAKAPDQRPQAAEQSGLVPFGLFHSPLLRLVLRGGGGLAPTYGPVVCRGSDALGHSDPNRGQWVWNPALDRAVRPDRAAAQVFADPPVWAFPTDAPLWLAHLAQVAAWMLGHNAVSAAVICDEHFITITMTMPRALLIRQTWRCQSGEWYGGPHAPDLPTLLGHLSAHPVEAALVLALYDVPKIKERVDREVLLIEKF